MVDSLVCIIKIVMYIPKTEGLDSQKDLLQKEFLRETKHKYRNTNDISEVSQFSNV